MKYLKYFFIAIILAILTVAGATYYYLGGFRSPELFEGKMPRLKVIYKPHLGAYHKVSTTITEVESWAKANGISCHKTFGEYLDKPDEVAEVDLRSNVGCVVDGKPNILPSLFNYKEFPLQKAFIAKFKGSPAIGPIKVYPLVKKWFTEQSKELTQSIEVYVLENDNFITTYYFPLEKISKSSTNETKH